MIIIKPLSRKAQIDFESSSLSRFKQVKPQNNAGLSKPKIYKISPVKKIRKDNKLDYNMKIDQFKKVTDPITQLVKALQAKVMKKKIKLEYKIILNQQVPLILKNNQKTKIRLGQLFQIYSMINENKIKNWVNGGCSALSEIKPFVKMYLQLKRGSSSQSLELGMQKSIVQSILKKYFQNQEEKQQKISQKWRKRCFADLADIYQQLFQRYENIPLDISEFQHLRQKNKSLEAAKVNSTQQVTVNNSKSKKDIMNSQTFIKMKFYDNLKSQIRELAKQTYKIINA